MCTSYKINNQFFAKLKIIHQKEHTKTESDLMVKLSSPFLVNIKFTFQSETKLYIVSDFIQVGDNFYYLQS